MSDQVTKRVTIPLRNVRLGFPALFRARKDEKNPEKKAKFEATFILDEVEHATVIKQIIAAQELLIAGQGWKPSVVKSVALRDGEDKVDGEGKVYDGFGKGKRYVTGRTVNKPKLVRTDKTDIKEEDNLLYPGAYVHAQVELYPYYNAKEPENGRRICATFSAVMFAKHGTPFGGGAVNVDEAFADVKADEGDGL